MGIWKGALSCQNTSGPLRQLNFYFSGEQARAHTPRLPACLRLNKSNDVKLRSFVAYDINSPPTSRLCDCAVNRFFFRIILTDGDLANLSTNPSFPSSFFFPFTSPLHHPPLQSVSLFSVLPLACLNVNLAIFTHFSVEVLQDFGMIWIVSRERIQMRCDSRGLHAAAACRINSFGCSVCLDSLAAGRIEPIRMKSAAERQLNPPSLDV